MLSIEAILSCDDNGGIAKNGIMPWPKNSIDMKHFRTMTEGHTVVMGRKTWEAADMPSPLPNRKNMVITRQPDFNSDDAIIIRETPKLKISRLSGRVFVIGGAEIFCMMLSDIDILHLTRVPGNWDCDTHISLESITNGFRCIKRLEADNLIFECYLSMRYRSL